MLDCWVSDYKQKGIFSLRNSIQINRAKIAKFIQKLFRTPKPQKISRHFTVNLLIRIFVFSTVSGMTYLSESVEISLFMSLCVCETRALIALI